MCIRDREFQGEELVNVEDDDYTEDDEVDDYIDDDYTDHEFDSENDDE